jgi:hypothetical protein
MTIPGLANPMYKKIPNGFANSICKKMNTDLKGFL